MTNVHTMLAKAVLYYKARLTYGDVDCEREKRIDAVPEAHTNSAYASIFMNEPYAPTVGVFALMRGPNVPVTYIYASTTFDAIYAAQEHFAQYAVPPEPICPVPHPHTGELIYRYPRLSRVDLNGELSWVAGEDRLLQKAKPTTPAWVDEMALETARRTETAFTTPGMPDAKRLAQAQCLITEAIMEAMNKEK